MYNRSKLEQYCLIFGDYFNPDEQGKIARRYNRKITYKNSTYVAKDGINRRGCTKTPGQIGIVSGWRFRAGHRCPGKRMAG